MAKPLRAGRDGVEGGRRASCARVCLTTPDACPALCFPPAPSSPASPPPSQAIALREPIPPWDPEADDPLRPQPHLHGSQEARAAAQVGQGKGGGLTAERHSGCVVGERARSPVDCYQLQLQLQAR